MHIVLLKFSANRSQASQFMEAHKAWLKHGFDDGVFLLAGSLEPDLGGGILAHNSPSADLHRRVNEDPFVTNDVVKAEILELDPGKADDRLKFLIS